MEALGRISVRCYSGPAYGGTSKNTVAPPPCSVRFPRTAPRRRSARLVLGASSGEYFIERGHLDYYSGAGKKISCGKGDCNKLAKKAGKQKKKMDKKRLKKMMMDQFEGGAISPEFGEEKVAQMISDAAEVLLEQLKQLKVEEKELEMVKGEDCDMMSSESSSSSSSSESSDSESDCKEAVTDMRKQNKSLDAEVIEPEKPLPLVVEDNVANHEFHLLGSPVEAALVSIFRAAAADQLDQLPHSNSTKVSSSIVSSSAGFPTPSARKVEVCVGGKCKKAGSVAVLGEFQRKLGSEYGAVSGCKCMGKCKVGPNVRITDDNLTSSLCIGVGLTDVDTIVANYFTSSPEYIV